MYRSTTYAGEDFARAVTLARRAAQQTKQRQRVRLCRWECGADARHFEYLPAVPHA